MPRTNASLNHAKTGYKFTTLYDLREDIEDMQKHYGIKHQVFGVQSSKPVVVR